MLNRSWVMWQIGLFRQAMKDFQSLRFMLCKYGLVLSRKSSTEVDLNKCLTSGVSLSSELNMHLTTQRWWSLKKVGIKRIDIFHQRWRNMLFKRKFNWYLNFQTHNFNTFWKFSLECSIHSHITVFIKINNLS